MDDLANEARGGKEKAEIFILLLLIVGWVTLSKSFRHLTHPLEALTTLLKLLKKKKIF